MPREADPCARRRASKFVARREVPFGFQHLLAEDSGSFPRSMASASCPTVTWQWPAATAVAPSGLGAHRAQRHRRRGPRGPAFRAFTQCGSQADREDFGARAAALTATRAPAMPTPGARVAFAVMRVFSATLLAQRPGWRLQW